jgi:hypothetical protein
MLPAESKRDAVSPALPEARPFADPLHDPFVGNETVDDNIVEWAQLGIWSALSGQRSNVSVGVKDGTATLAGTAQSQEQRQAIAEAVARVRGVRQVVDRIRLARLRPLRTQLALPATALGLEHVTARAILYVVRYCVLDEASISAAMRQAVPLLEGALVAHGQLPMRELIVIYRIGVPGAVTVQIGVPVDLRSDAVVEGEPEVGRSPGGTMLSKVADAGLQGLLRSHTELVATARATGLEAESLFWQSFPRDRAQPWQGYPRARVFLPIITPLESRQMEAGD